MKANWKEYKRLLAVAGFVVLIDQATKLAVRSRLLLGEVWEPWEQLADQLFVVHWKNTGMFMGALEGFGIVFTVLALVVAAAGVYYYPRLPEEDRLLRTAFALQIGGVTGNLLDRLAVGYVTDFLAIGPLPVFNLADISIYLGLLILLAGLLLRPERKPGETKAGSSPP